MKADLILKNIGKLVTMQGSSSFRVKEEMNKINIIENAYIAVKNGKILAIGVGDEFGNLCGEDTKIHDAEGLLVTPGLIDFKQRWWDIKHCKSNKRCIRRSII